MLQLDIDDFSEAAVKFAIEQRLAPYGKAVIMRLLPGSDRSANGVVAMRFTTWSEARKVVRHFGGSRHGSIAVIKLAYGEAPAGVAINPAADRSDVHAG